MPFQPRQSSFLSNVSIIFTGSLWAALRKAGLLVMRYRCRFADGRDYLIKKDITGVNI